MKKRLFYLVFFLILAFIFILNINSANIDDSLEKVESNIDKVSNVQDTLNDKDLRSQYLKREWNKILENSSFGRFLLGISAIFVTLSPIFSLIIGVEYSLSWMFFLSLTLWIVTFFIVFYSIKLIFPDKFWICFFISFIIPALAAQTQMFPRIISMFTPLFTNSKIILIAIIITFVLLWVYIYFMKFFVKTIEHQDKKEKEKRREEKAKLVEKIHDISIKSTGVKK